MPFMLAHGVKWQAFWCGIPEFPLEHIFTVDQTGLWRRHMLWANSDGERLRTLLTQRLASNVIYLSLLLSTEIGVFFSPSSPLNEVREDFEQGNTTLEFAAGLVLCFGILMTVSAFMANFTAWSIVAAISNENIHSILRSSIGLYASILPSRLIVRNVPNALTAIRITLSTQPHLPNHSHRSLQHTYSLHG